MHIKISITDDHPLVLSGLQTVLLRYPHISLSGVYNNGESLMEGLQENLPDVLLLDIQMPGKTGDELAPVLLKKYPNLKIIALTNFDSSLYINNMFKIGIHGYLLKTSEERVIIDAIETVYNGGLFIEQTMKKKMDELELRVLKTVFIKCSLTAREKAILKHIVDGKTTQDIADTLFLSVRTVENYRLNIQIKLDVTNIAMLVKKALQMGLVD
jgi:DNA-binding NarL/FixJ family response regulator